jgi:hypothetical protein
MKNTKDTIANLESIIATLATRIEELGEDLGEHLSAEDMLIAIECQPEEEEPEFSTIAQCQSWRRGKLSSAPAKVTFIRIDSEQYDVAVSGEVVGTLSRDANYRSSCVMDRGEVYTWILEMDDDTLTREHPVTTGGLPFAKAKRAARGLIQAGGITAR